MSAVEVRPITLPQDAGRFVKSWWKIYEGDSHWVPPVIIERKSFLNPKKNPFFKVAEVQCFMAYKDGQPVGTIAATVDRNYQHTQPGMGFFGFFEFVDDLAVSKALYEAAAEWLRSKGMKKTMGPFNFTTNHEFGLLVDGFDTDPCIANPHNRDYYEKHYLALGMIRNRDWYAYWVEPVPVPAPIERISKRFLERHPNVKIRPIDKANYESEVHKFWELYNDAWEKNWGHVHLEEEEFQVLAGNLKSILDPDFCWVAEVDGEAAAVVITLHDYNQIAKKMNGSIFPFGWWHFLFGKKKINTCRVFILGVKQKFQHMPLGAPLYIKTWEAAINHRMQGCEASLILEDNYRMRGAMEKLGGRIYKTYRTYEIALVEGAEVPLLVDPKPAEKEKGQSEAQG